MDNSNIILIFFNSLDRSSFKEAKMLLNISKDYLILDDTIYESKYDLKQNLMVIDLCEWWIDFGICW